MQSLLFILGLGLVSTFEFPPLIPLDPYFKYDKIGNTWYRLAMVVTGAEQEVLAGDIRLSPRSKGDLALQRNIQRGSMCLDVNFQLKHTGTPGKFTLFSADAETNIYVVGTDHKCYLILLIVTPADQALYLFGREEQVPNRVWTEFNDHAVHLKFSLDDIKLPERDEQCPVVLKKKKRHSVLQPEDNHSCVSEMRKASGK